AGIVESLGRPLAAAEAPPLEHGIVEMEAVHGDDGAVGEDFPQTFGERRLARGRRSGDAHDEAPRLSGALEDRCGYRGDLRHVQGPSGILPLTAAAGQKFKWSTAGKSAGQRDLRKPSSKGTSRIRLPARTTRNRPSLTSTAS